jgi:putative hydrolase of the HAD superfamily
MPFTALFVDVGEVLLTNGWARDSRQRAAEKFSLDFQEMDERHHLTFDSYEAGRITLDQYLERVVFYEKRHFSPQDFRAFMFSQSSSYPEMIELVRALKARYKLKVVAINNEGRELNEYRIKRFKLSSFVDLFISSCFVHVRKPDEKIYRTALDVAQVAPEEVINIDDRQLFVEVAQSLGIHGILHTGHDATLAALAKLGLTLQQAA